MSGPITPPLTVTTASGTPSGRPITTIKVSDGDLTISGNVATIDTSGSGGSIGGSIADTQVAFGSGTDTITGDAALTFISSTEVLNVGDTHGYVRVGGGSNISPSYSFISNTDIGLRFHTLSPGDALRVVVDGDDQLDFTNGSIQPALTNDIDIGTASLKFKNAWFNDYVDADVVRIGAGTSGNEITTNTTEDLVLNTNTGTNSGSITITDGANGDIDIVTDGTGVTEIQNSTTDNDTTLSVKGNGTGDAIINLNNPTKSVQLICDTNQKLKVQGGVNTFIFDASSATGGIQWPDGTIQTTAASGGGGLDTTPNIMQTQLPTAGSNLLQFPLFAQFGTADTTTNSVVQFNTTTAVLFPFFAPKTGDVQSITCKISVTNVDDILVSMYNSDSDNLPNTRIGDEATWDMGTSGEVTLDVSGLTDTWNLTAGSLYYLAMMLETDTTNRPTFYTYDAQDGGGHNTNLPTNDTTTATYQPGNSVLKLSSLSAALPSSITTSDLTGHRPPFYRVPVVGVVM